MELLVLNQQFRWLGVIDAYESMIWTERFSEYGDFEIVTTVNQEHLNLARQDYYVTRTDTRTIMIIEKVEIRTDVDEGSRLTISGRSLESILTRRLIWSQTILDGNLQNGIQRLITDAIIEPTDSKRARSNFKFQLSEDPNITSLKVRCQFTGDVLYTAVKDICDAAEIGFRIYLDDDLNFIFELYAGSDRSYEQSDNPYVIFSPNFDNIINSNYMESKMEWCNIALVAGEDEGEKRRTKEVGDSEATGLDRRELYVDARDIQSDDASITTAEYNAQLESRGNEKLAEHSTETMFEGGIDYMNMFVYGRDFYMGDICQIENEYGLQARVRITEYVMSDNVSDGVSAYPTFTMI